MHILLPRASRIVNNFSPSPRFLNASSLNCITLKERKFHLKIRVPSCLTHHNWVKKACAMLSASFVVLSAWTLCDLPLMA